MRCVSYTFSSCFVYFFRIHLKKSGTNIPLVELSEMGPHADLTVRRSRLASSDLLRQACKQPKVVKVWQQ